MDKRRHIPGNSRYDRAQTKRRVYNGGNGSSGFFAVSHYYHIPLAQLLYAGDDVSGEEWDSRNWNTQKNIRYELLRIAIEIVKNCNYERYSDEDRD